MPDQSAIASNTRMPSVDPIREHALNFAAKTLPGASADCITHHASIYETYLRDGAALSRCLGEAAMSAVNLSAVTFGAAMPSAPADYVPVGGWPERGASPTPFACIERTFEVAARVFYFGSVEQALEERGCLAAHYPGTEWNVFIQL